MPKINIEGPIAVYYSKKKNLYKLPAIKTPYVCIKLRYTALSFQWYSSGGGSIG